MAQIPQTADIPLSHDDSNRLIAHVEHALHTQTPLRIRGGNTKAFLGRPVQGDEIDTRTHCGIVNYEPTELCVTVRAGTPLAELVAVLDAAQQMLPCEPPAFGKDATVGGMVAAGLSGPRRPWVGAVRDYVLGCRIISGHGKYLRFGGEVMKNVAGYDVSRLMAGSFGCLGLITEVSMKVLPKPRAAQSRMLELDAQHAQQKLVAWRRAGLPVSGACHANGQLYVRLEGGTGSVSAAVREIGGETFVASFWDDLREHRLPFFADPRPLWRLSLPAGTSFSSVPLPKDMFSDWGGAQRWLKSDANASTLRKIALIAGGHATRFTPVPTNLINVDANNADDCSFAPLTASLFHLHQQLKQQLDPKRIFNPSHLYPEL